MNSVEHSQVGMTTTEVLIMASIMSVLMIMVTESMTTLSSVRCQQQARFHIANVADRVARQIDTDISFSSRIFCNGVEDSAYLDLMELPFPLTTPAHRLPTLTARGYFEPDSTTIETGNVLFLARRGPKLMVRLPGSGEFLVESLQFVVYAPVQDGERLELMRWTSELTLNYWDVADIDDPEARAELLSQLQDCGVLYAWDPLAPAGRGVWELADGILLPLEPDQLVLGGEDPVNSRPFGERAMQIAENGWSTVLVVPAFAKADGAFPGGFEIRADGSTSGKLILLRLVTRSLKPNVGDVANEVRRFFFASG